MLQTAIARLAGAYALRGYLPVSRAARLLRAGLRRLRGKAAPVPCNNLDASQAFYARLGFSESERKYDEYRILSDGKGGELHLAIAPKGWVLPGRNPFAVYLYTEDVDELAGLLGARPKTSLGACTNSASPIRMKHWFELGGRHDCTSRFGRLLSRACIELSA